MEPDELATRLIEQMQRGEPLDLAEGAVSIESLQAAIATVSDGPLAAELFVWLWAQGSQRELAYHLAATTDDPGAAAEIVTWLGSQSVDELGDHRALFRLFLDRASARSAHYGVRSQALRAAMLAARRTPPLSRQLHAWVLDVELEDDPEFLRHAARIAGALLSWTPADDLRELLRRLADVDRVADEAAVELGADALRLGLDATTHEAALAAFRSAADWFRTASEASDGRPDAVLYGSCVALLLDFQEGSHERLASRANELRSASFEYAALLGDGREPSQTWIGSSDAERLQWSQLGFRLSALDTSLRERAWLEAARVVEDELVAVYDASRSLLGRDKEGGLETLLRPKISGALRRDQIYLDYLDAWIARNVAGENRERAEAMRQEVLAARTRSLRRDPSEVATGGPTVVTSILKKQGGLSPRDAAAIVASIEQDVLALSEACVSPAVASVVARVTGDMSADESYRTNEEARAFFNALILLTVRFVASRQDIAKSSVPRLDYLFERDANKLPLEKALQADYHEFLAGSPVANAVSAEVRDLAGGRVDVLFTRNAIKTVAELKREFADRTLEGLVDEYGLQAISYQSTNVTFGILLVLDLHDRDGGQGHLTTQVAVVQRKPKWDDQVRTIVVFRVQGRRKTPSDL